MRMNWRGLGFCIVALTVVASGAHAQTLHTYWADLQGDNRTGATPVEFYTFGRDSVSLDVVALTPHASNMSITKWNSVKSAATALYAPGTYVTFSGYEWNSGAYGHKVVKFLTDDQPLIVPNAPESNHPNEFFALLKATNGWAHVAHPSLKSVTTNWNFHDPDVQLNAEIVSRWDTYETHPTNGKSIRDAWARGYRVGVLGTSDSDSLPGIVGGLTAILATNLTRESIHDALVARRTYATTGKKIGLEFKVGNATFGEIVNDVIGDAQVFVSVQGTAPVSRVETRRNGDLINQFSPAPSRTFVELGDPLSYFKGSVEPPAAWNTLGFNDAGWLPGRAGVGFGDNDDVTTITGMKNNYLSIYTRQRFSVTDVVPQYLYMGVDYDDGFIAYIDGIEVLRVNMPDTSFVAHNVKAGPFREPNKTAKAVAGATQPPFYTNNGLPSGTPTNPLLDIFDISDFRNILSPGIHVLSIQVHNSLLSSGDLTLIPRLYEPDPSTSATVSFTDAGAAGDRYYDVKVIQLDGEIAWSSPIWLNPDAPPRTLAALSDTPVDNGNALNLSWTKSVATDFGYYNIYVSESEFLDAAGMTPWNSTPIYNADSLTVTVDSFNGQPLIPNRTYYAFVGAFDWPGKMNSTTFGMIASSAPVDNMPPAAPVSTQVIDTPGDDGGSLILTWGLSPDDGAGVGDVVSYEIFRRTSSGSYGSSPLATRLAGITSYQDPNTNDASQYYYRVRATDGRNPSMYTAEFGPISSVDNGGLAEPQNVSAADVPNDQGGHIEVSWDLIAGDTLISHYLVYRTTTPGSYGPAYASVSRGTSSFTDSAAGRATDYSYAIVSVDSVSSNSSTFSAEAGPIQAIDDIAPARVTVIDAVDNALGGSANVSWVYDESLVSDLERYDIYYKTRNFSGVRTISPIMSAAVGDTLAVVGELLNGKGYYFTVVPVDSSGNFFNTSLSKNFARPTDATPPTFAGVESTVPGDASLSIRWTPAQDNTLPIEYSLYMATSPDSFNFVTPSFMVPGSTPIVSLGDPWHYFKGIVAPPVAWNQKVYDASGWLSSEGAFGYDSHTTVLYETATTFLDMEGSYTSVFFRKDFELAAIPENLSLGILADDGYIAYINGVEVARDNLDDPVSHISLAEKGINAPWTGTLDPLSPTNYNPNPVLKQVDLSAYVGLLTLGQNVLAIQVHNRKKANPDFLFLAGLSTANNRFTVNGLNDGVQYFFTMRASDGSGNSENNIAVRSGVPLVSPPPAVVTSLATARSTNVLTISWSPVTTDSAGASMTPDHYNVYRGPTVDFTPDVTNHSNLLASVPGLTYDDFTALSTNGDLYYRVTAVSSSNRETHALSPVAMKVQRVLTHQPGTTNLHWITLPYISGIPDAQTLVLDLNGAPFPGPVSRIQRFNPITQTTQSLSFDNGAWVGENFPIAAGESYAITLQSTLNLTVVGAHRSNVGFNYARHQDKSSFYMLGLPLHGNYANAGELLQDLNGGSAGTNVSKLVRVNPSTGEFDSYMYFDGQWLGNNFAITPGQGYAIVVRTDINGWSPQTK